MKKLLKSLSAHRFLGHPGHKRGPGRMLLGYLANESQFGRSACVQERVVGLGLDKALVDGPGERLDLSPAQVRLKRRSLMNRRCLGGDNRQSEIPRSRWFVANPCGSRDENHLEQLLCQKLVQTPVISSQVIMLHDLR